MLSKLNIENYKPAVKPEKKVRPERYEGEGKFGPRRNFTKIPNRIIDHEIMSIQEKMVLITLMRLCFDKGHCEVSVEKIRQLSGVRKATIYKALKKLEVEKYIKKHTVFGWKTDYEVLSFGY